VDNKVSDSLPHVLATVPLAKELPVPIR